MRSIATHPHAVIPANAGIHLDLHLDLGFAFDSNENLTASKPKHEANVKMDPGASAVRPVLSLPKGWDDGKWHDGMETA